jgi:hypothetical protein
LRLSVSVTHRIGSGENTRLIDREDLFDTRDVATLVCRSLKSGSLGTSLSAARPHLMLERVRVAPSMAPISRGGCGRLPRSGGEPRFIDPRK